MEDKLSILVAMAPNDVRADVVEVFENDYNVLCVDDGTAALEQAVIGFPELIIYDADCGSIGATQFQEIVSNLPKVKHTPVVFLADLSKEPLDSGQAKYPALNKPFNIHELQSAVIRALRRRDYEGASQNSDDDLRGDLEHVGLPDLLQIFSMNRRSGRLQAISIDHNYGAEIFLRDGQIVETIYGAARGRKALFRVLGFKRGQFNFRSKRMPPSESIQGSTEHLLMLGHQELDELEHKKSERPAHDAQVERIIEMENIDRPLSPCAHEVLALMEFHSRIGEIIDNTQWQDSLVWMTLEELRNSNWIRVADGTGMLPAPLVSMEAVADFNARVAQGPLPDCYKGQPRLVVLVEMFEQLEDVTLWCRELREFVADQTRDVRQHGFGSLGALHFGSVTRVQVDIYVLRPHIFPLLVTGAVGAVGGICVVPKGTMELYSEEVDTAVSQLKAQRGIELVMFDGEDATGFRKAMSQAVRQAGDFLAS
jgi:hypothetical protein